MSGLETFLENLPKPLVVVGGSPLYTDIPPEYALSINGFRKGYAAVINNNRNDSKRVKYWERVLVPNPNGRRKPDHYLLPEHNYTIPSFAGFQPTTYFSLLYICDCLEIPVDIFGICGRASKYHDGDWELHFMKITMKHVTFHDPRPAW